MPLLKFGSKHPCKPKTLSLGSVAAKQTNLSAQSLADMYCRPAADPGPGIRFGPMSLIAPQRRSQSVSDLLNFVPRIAKLRVINWAQAQYSTVKGPTCTTAD